ncbi:MarR family transcriptional regulator [Desulfosporosinus sp. PR]|uniref:MarR family transcriptional regulator n=1 Tax=Candidatus Desulfosporosinus nitrosoreducens TaxID=3401928 RepID=UPI0027EF993A|nr:MarR family transcriptional regulator [Desulfosporosinus sp. PR]MDQ7093216.1 MarR family transcriptional regulator [Desulfosporosinus sp. PR]
MNITEDIIDALQRMQEDIESMTHKLDDTLNLSKIHCIHSIGNIENPNVTKIAAELGMTTGAITKICKKLFRDNYIEKYQNPENNKEVYYKLTAKGHELYEIHKVIHNEIYNFKIDIINKYSSEEQTIILNFLKDIYAMMNKVSAKAIKSVPLD